MSDVKLYRVTIECDVWVIARSERDAEAILSTERDVLDDVRENASVTAVAVATEAGARGSVSHTIDDDSYPWRARDTEDADDMPVSEWAMRTRSAIAWEQHEAKMAAAQTTIPGGTL